jgi:hypothetical protein
MGSTVQREFNFSLTKKTGVQKLVMEPIFRSKILDGVRVVPNVSNKKKLGFMTNMKRMLQKDVGCKWNPKDLGGDVYVRTIEVEPIKINAEFCADQYKDTILQNNFQKTGNLSNDLTGTQIGAAIITSVRETIPSDCLELFWFGKKDSNNTFFNIMDGLWTVYLRRLAEDDLAPYVDTGSGTELASGEAEAILKAMYKAQSNVLKGLSKSKKRFYVTDSVWEGWFQDSANLFDTPAGRLQIINGEEVLHYRGIQLIQDVTWDDTMTKDYGSPDSHLALLTTPDNLIMATDVLGDKNKLDFWYDKKTEENDLKVKFKLGANYVHPAFFVIGY